MWSQARANVWEPERPALRIKTFTGRQYIVSPPRCGGAAGTDAMSKDHTKTVQIRKVDKVAPDHRGRSVWLGKIEPVELELVSTTALEKILKTEGGKTRTEIQKLAAGRKNGVLARDTATGHFRILSDADLKKAATEPPGDGPKRSGVVTAARAHRNDAQESRGAFAGQHPDPAQGREAGRQDRDRKAAAGQQEGQVRGLQPLRQQLTKKGKGDA